MIDFEKLATEVRLTEMSHASPEDGMCVMEMVAWFAGERHSDSPECSCPILTYWAIELNDCAPTDEDRQRLIRLVPMLAGTVDGTAERARFTVKRKSYSRRAYSTGLTAADFWAAEGDLVEAACSLHLCAEEGQITSRSWRGLVRSLETAIKRGKHGEVDLSNSEARADELRALVAA